MLNFLDKKWMYVGATGGVPDLAIGYSTASQLPGRQVGGPADVLRHLVLGGELTRRFGEIDAGRIALDQVAHRFREEGGPGLGLVGELVV